jgi:hypothetical protein
VRAIISYRRYASAEAALLLEAMQKDLHAYVNSFQPVQKLVEKRRDGAKIYKRYDLAQTPHQRALASPVASAICKMRLQRTFCQLNPAQLRRQMDDNMQ